MKSSSAKTKRKLISTARPKVVLKPKGDTLKFMKKLGISSISTGDFSIEQGKQPEPKDYICPACSNIQQDGGECENCDYFGLAEM